MFIEKTISHIIMWEDNIFSPRYGCIKKLMCLGHKKCTKDAVESD